MVWNRRDLLVLLGRIHSTALDTVSEDLLDSDSKTRNPESLVQLRQGVIRSSDVFEDVLMDIPDVEIDQRMICRK